MIEKQMQGDRSTEDQRIAPRLRETRQRGDKLVMTRTAVKPRAQQLGFLIRNHHQTNSRPPESRNMWFHTKDRAVQCISPHMWTGGMLESIPGAFIMRLPCSTIYPVGFSPSKHKLTSMFSIACSTPGTISSLFSIIRSPAAGIKPVFVSRFTKQNCWRNIPTNDLTNRSIERN